jgi:hypothetical protein
MHVYRIRVTADSPAIEDQGKAQIVDAMSERPSQQKRLSIARVLVQDGQTELLGLLDLAAVVVLLRLP